MGTPINELTDDQMITLAREAVTLEANAVVRVVDQITSTLPQAVRLVEGARGKILTTGSGTSSQVARRMAHLLSVSGTPSLFVHSMDALHGTVGAVQSGDVLIAISKTGESDEVLEFSKLAREVGAPVIGISERAGSSMEEVSDIFVLLSTAEGADPGDTLAMGSTLVTAVWGDALARVLMKRRGWETEDSLRIHPAGGVGKIARAVLDEGEG